jgi:hypothetical protein
MYGKKYACMGKNKHVWKKISMSCKKYACMTEKKHV